MKFGTRDKILFPVFAILIIFFWSMKSSLSTVYLIGFMIVGLIIAIFASEKAVEGIDVFGKRMGLTPYVSGVLSSLASNSPELVIGGFAILNGKVEFAIAFIIIATGFNILMLGILVMIGNYQRKKPITIPKEVIDIEVPIVRVAIVIVGAIFIYGIVLFCLEAFQIAMNAEETIPYLPYEASVITVIVYLFYLFFIIRHNLKSRDLAAVAKASSDHKFGKRSLLVFTLLLAFGMIFFAGEMISSSVELFLEHSEGVVMSEFQLAFFIGAAASIPEHAIALLAVKHEGGIELGLGNLIAGTMQNLLLMTGLVSLFSYIGALVGIEGNSLQGIPLIHYVQGTGEVPTPFLLVQFGFAWLLLFMIKSSMTDDQKLDIYEGFTITIAQLFVFVIFLKGILKF